MYTRAINLIDTEELSISKQKSSVLRTKGRNDTRNFSTRRLCDHSDLS